MKDSVGLPPARCTRLYVGAVRYIVVPYKEKGDAVDRMPWFECTRRVRRDVIVVFVSLRWGSPSQQENFSHHHHVAAPTLRSRTHVSALALLNPKTSRFVAVTSYRCRVRFRRPA